MELPRKPGKEAGGVFAHDKLARLVEAVNVRQTLDLGSEHVECQNLHEERESESHRDEEVFRGNVARLEDTVAKEATVSARG